MIKREYSVGLFFRSKSGPSTTGYLSVDTTTTSWLPAPVSQIKKNVVDAMKKQLKQEHEGVDFDLAVISISKMRVFL